MICRRGKYYYRNVRIGKRVRSEYIGAGDVGELLAYLDQIQVEQRQLERIDRRQQLVAFRQDTAVPPELGTYSAAVRGLVADVLGRLGFHRHKRQWRRQRMDKALERRAGDLFFKQKATAAELKTFRQMLDEHTALARGFGDLAVVAEKLLVTGFKDHQQMRDGARVRVDQLRAGLGYDESSALEQLLIDEIVLCWLDHYRIEISYAQQTKDAFTLPALDQWEQVLTSKQRRYLRALEALARVRRLLRLPGPQFNINMPGGQQVNIGGDVAT